MLLALRPRPLVALLLLALVLHTVYVWLSPAVGVGRVIVADGLYLLVVVLAGGLALWNARQLGVRVLAGSFGALALAEAWMLQYDFPGHEAPDASVADPLYITYYLGLIFVLWQLQQVRTTPEQLQSGSVLAQSAAAFSAWGWMLDSLIVVLVVGEVAWVTFLKATLSDLQTSPLLWGLNLTYVVLDLLVLGLALQALRRHTAPALLVFGVGVLAYIAADFQYFSLELHGQYSAAHSLDSLWAWGSSLQVCGLLWAWPQVAGLVLPDTGLPGAGLPSAGSPGAGLPSAGSPGAGLPGAGSVVTRQFLRLHRRLLLTLPYLAVGGACVLLLLSERPQLHGKDIAAWTVIIFVVAMLRQTLMLLERDQLTRQLRQQVYQDALTGLANRAAFDQQMTQLPPEPQALYFLDLDGFKTLNDTLGHEAGDQALQQIARRLQDFLPPEAFVARLGGDEFTILLPHQTEAQAQAFLGQIGDVIAQPLALAAGHWTLAASVGLAYWQGGPLTDPEALRRSADAQMYSEKRRRRGNNTRF